MRKPTLKIGKSGNQQTIELDKCPANYLDKDHFYLYSLYNHYEAGFLPIEGGIILQPAIYVQAMHVIKGEVSKIQEAKAKKNKR